MQAAHGTYLSLSGTSVVLIELSQGTLYFMAIDLLTSGDVVHEVRHDLESFFWLLVWIVLRHTAHTFGARACENLFGHDDEDACQDAKTGFLTNTRILEVGIKPLDELIDEFRSACQTNYRVRGAEPSDPLTHEKVLEMFDKALDQKSEWPTLDDEALPYEIPDDDEDLRQRGERLTSNINSNRIDSQAGTPISIESGDILPGGQKQGSQALSGGARRSRRIANAVRGGTVAPSGSQSRKRSREAGETTNAANSDPNEEQAKRTRTMSEHKSGGGQSGRKQSKVRRGRR